MENMIAQTAKLLSHTIMVHVYSYPHFAIEAFLAVVVCVVHCLIIFEVNSLYRRTNAKAAAKLRMRHPPFKGVESCSYHTISRLQTQIFPQKIETMTRQSYYRPPFQRISRNISSSSNFGWVVSHGDSLFRHEFTDRVQHLLSISPSEYVRKDRERKTREAGIRTCINSLTSLLEKAMVNDTLHIENLSKETIKQSINAIRENLESHLSRDSYPMGEFGSSIHSMLMDSMNKKALRDSLSPQLINMQVSLQTVEHNKSCNDANDDNQDSNSKSSSDSLKELFNEDKCVKVLHGNEKISLPCP